MVGDVGGSEYLSVGHLVFGSGSMRPLRIPLAGLLVLIVLLAVGFTGLRQASELWASATYSLALALLFLALLGVLFQRGEARVYWGGFALCGWGYLLLGLGSPLGSETLVVYRWAGANPAAAHPPLVTTKLLEYLYEYVEPSLVRSEGDHVEVQWGNPGTYYPASVVERKDGQYRIRWDGYPQSSTEWVAAARVKPGDVGRFVQVGHCLLAPLAGVVGAVAARLLWSRSKSGQEASSPKPVTS